MALVEKVETIIVRFGNGREVELKPCSVSEVKTRTDGQPMSEHGNIAYWHIIAQERNDGND